MKKLSDEISTLDTTRVIIAINYGAALVSLVLALLFLLNKSNSFFGGTGQYGVGLLLFTITVIFLATAILLGRYEKSKLRTGALRQKLQEKETLLKEVHHRVKNNLQTVSSLLSLQSRAIADNKISSIIKGSQHRVVSMAMVHEMLYKRDDYSSKIDLKPYIEELCSYLVRSVKGNDNNITSNLNISDCQLSIDTVIPLGLIINETVTNALKYGIPGDSKGEIAIGLHKNGSKTYELYLSDDGIGFPENVNPTNTKSLGLKLIHNLARQLRGSIVRDSSKKGTYYQITFEEVVEDFNSVD